jgi:hypothetical protein
MGEIAYGVFGQVDYLLGVMGILHYARCAVQDGCMKPDPYLRLLDVYGKQRR